MAIIDEIAAINADPSVTDKRRAIRELKAVRHRDQLALNLNTWISVRAAAPSREVYITSVMVDAYGDLRVEFMARQGGVNVLAPDGTPFFIATYRNPPVLDETKTQDLIKVGRILLDRTVTWPS